MAQGCDASKRTRKSAPRSRNGCITCRIRHLKCDERKPACARCAHAGMKCDGYAPSAKCKKEKKRQHNASDSNECVATSTAPLKITAYAIPFQIPGSQKDRQMIHYFCMQGSHDLSGYLISDFWSRVVLQYSHAEPVVRQALVALSSIHLEFVTLEFTGRQQKRGGGHDIETLLQYNRAVGQLRRYLSNTVQPSIRVALVCCALFYCFESTHGDYDRALEHLRSGLMMLETARASGKDTMRPHGSPNLPDDLEQLAQVFSRLDLQATMFDDTRTPFLELTSAEERRGCTPVVPNLVFSDLAEAQVTLDKLQNQLLNFLTRNNHYKFVSAEDLPESIVQEKHELRKQFRRWSDALDEFGKTQSQSEEVGRHLHDQKDEIKFQQGTTVLKIHHSIAQMFLSASFPEDSSIFGASPNQDAEFILESAEFLIQRNQRSHLNAPSTSSSPPRSFSAENGIVAPLSLLAMKCHNPQVSERAVSLLAASNRREGLIDAHMVLGIVRRVTMLKQTEEITPLVAEAVKRSPAMCVEEVPLEVWGAEAINGTKDGLQGIAKMLDVPR